jgi:hypothetical protein
LFVGIHLDARPPTEFQLFVVSDQVFLGFASSARPAGTGALGAVLRVQAARPPSLE